MPENIISAIIVFTDLDKEHLSGCLKSLEKSASIARLKLDLVLVANGTAAPSLKSLKKIPKIIDIKKKVGFGNAVNRGLKQAKGEWCAIICPDVITSKNSMIKLLPLTSDPHVGLIGPGIMLSGQSLQASALPVPSLWNIFIEQSYLYKLLPRVFPSPLSDKNKYLKSSYVNAVAAIWWLIRKKAFETVGGFDERFFLYFEDVDLCMRLRKSGYLIMFQPEVTVIHSPHESTGGMTSGRLYVRSLKKILNKYHSPLYSNLALFIFRLGCLVRMVFWSLYTKIMTDQKRGVTQKIIFYRDVLKIP